VHLPSEERPNNVACQRPWGRENFGGEKQQLWYASQQVINSALKPFTVVIGRGMRRDRPQLK